MKKFLKKLNIFNMFQLMLQKDFVIELEKEEQRIKEGEVKGKVIELPEYLSKDLLALNEHLYDIEIRRKKKLGEEIKPKWRKFRNALLMYGTDQILIIERDNFIMFLYYIKDNFFAMILLVTSILILGRETQSILKYILFVCLLIFPLFFIFYTYVRKYLLTKLNFILVTPDGVDFYRTKGFRGLKSSKLSVHTIDKVNYTKNGILQSLMDTGNILFWQSGTRTKADAELFGAKDPEKLCKIAGEILAGARKAKGISE